jgi:hypothetical protein
MRYTGTVYGKNNLRCRFLAYTTAGLDEPAGSCGNGQDALEKRCIKLLIVGKPADVGAEINYYGDYAWAFEHGEITVTSVKFDKPERE